MKSVYRILITGFYFLVIAVATVSCSSTGKLDSSASMEADANKAETFTIEKSGAQLWGETCIRCHLPPSPADYNDTDWETIALHMRVRANLTEKNIAKIEEFLKSAN